MSLNLEDQTWHSLKAMYCQCLPRLSLILRNRANVNSEDDQNTPHMAFLLDKLPRAQ